MGFWRYYFLHVLCEIPLAIPPAVQGLIGIEVMLIEDHVTRMNGVTVMHSHARPLAFKRRMMVNHGGMRVVAMNGSVFQSYHVKIILETRTQKELQDPGNVYVMLDIQVTGLRRDLTPAHSAQRGNFLQPGIQRCAEITQIVPLLLNINLLDLVTLGMQHVFVNTVMGHPDPVARNVRLVITKIREPSLIQGVQNVV